jgi:hypothetical protein
VIGGCGGAAAFSWRHHGAAIVNLFSSCGLHSRSNAQDRNRHYLFVAAYLPAHVLKLQAGPKRRPQDDGPVGDPIAAVVWCCSSARHLLFVELAARGWSVE